MCVRPQFRLVPSPSLFGWGFEVIVAPWSSRLHQWYSKIQDEGSIGASLSQQQLKGTTPVPVGSQGMSSSMLTSGVE